MCLEAKKFGEPFAVGTRERERFDFFGRDPEAVGGKSCWEGVGFYLIEAFGDSVFGDRAFTLENGFGFGEWLIELL